MSGFTIQQSIKASSSLFPIKLTQKIMRYLLHILCALVAITYAQEDTSSAKVHVDNTWGETKKARQMKGWCEFELQEKRDKGEIHVDLMFNKKTRNLQIWTMNIVKTLNKGRAYELTNKDPHNNAKVKIEFILTYKGSKKRPPKGVCISNIPPTSTVAPTTLPTSTEVPSSSSPPSSSSLPSSPLPSQSTTILPTNTDMSPIVIESSWKSGEGFMMTGVCRFIVKPTLWSYGVMIEFDKETYDMTEWNQDIREQDPSGLWYYIVSRNPEHNREMQIRFQVKYDSEPAPEGVCNLDTSLEPTTKTPSSSLSPTNPPSSTASPTSQPSSAAPSPSPSTDSPTNQPSSASPSPSSSVASSSSPAPPPSTSQQTMPSSTAVPTQSSSVSVQSTSSPTQPPTSPPSTLQPPTLNTKYDYGLILNESILFYEAQQSGHLTYNRIPWRGDSATNDFGPNGEDLTGGWYDAGDAVKFNLPMASATTNLALGLLKWKDSYENAGNLDYMYKSIKWPLDYLLKCWNAKDKIYYAQVGDGHVDHSHWRRPETITNVRPTFFLDSSKKGSDVTGETAAAMATGAMVFKDIYPEYSNTLLSSAESLYEFAKSIAGTYNADLPGAADFYRSSDYKDELCTSGALLYMATGKQQYLTEAEQVYNSYGNDNPRWAFDWDDKTVLCLVLLHEITGKSVYKTRVEKFVSSYMPGGSVTQTPCGLAWRLEWGSLRYSANAAFIATLAADTGIGNANAYKTWAMSQIHYMVGDNKGFSFLIGYGSRYPLRPHHQGSSCELPPATCDWNTYNSPSPNPFILHGALVGGPNNQDVHDDNRNNFRTNEVACDYNAGFQSAVAGLLHFALAGSLPNAPVAKCP